MKNTKAFTLVELIVVITIIAILWTIAFISLQWYSKSSRDSVRISDVSNMKTSLELFHLNAWKYPLPDDNEEVTYQTETLWYQWFFWNNVVSQLSRNMSEIPTDPLTDKKYIFSVSNNKNEFEILALLESDLVLNTVNQTNAANLIVTPRVDWNYNWVFIKTAWYIVPVPSIMTSEQITWWMALTSTNIKSQIISGWNNIPNYWNINYNTWALTNLNLSVFTWSVIASDTDATKAGIMQIIQAAYSGSELASDNKIAFILSKSTEADLAALLDTIVLNNSSSTVSWWETPVDLNGNDEFTKLLVHSDDIVNMEEDFNTGSIDTNKWTILDLNWTSEINNNRYEWTVVGQSEYSRTRISSKNKFSWDFDIQIDAGIITKSWDDFVYWKLMITWFESLAYVRMSANWSYFNSDIGHWNGSTRVWDDTNNLNYSWLWDTWNQTKVRITRVASTLTTYGWNWTSWLQISTFWSWYTGNVGVYLVTTESVWTFPDCSTWIDNFTINSWSAVLNKFIDSSSAPKTITANWDVHHSTTEKQFWATSMYFDWDGDYLEISDSEDWDFGTWDFTVDFWVKMDSKKEYNSFVVKRTSWLSEDSFEIIYKEDWTDGFFLSFNNNIYNKNFSFTASVDIRYHLAVIRNWSIIDLFVDWEKQWTGIDIWTNAITNWNNEVYIGAQKSGWVWGREMNWYIDELRISKWTARWTEDFDTELPTAPYWN